MGCVLQLDYAFEPWCELGEIRRLTGDRSIVNVGSGLGERLLAGLREGLATTGKVNLAGVVGKTLTSDGYNITARKLSKSGLDLRDGIRRSNDLAYIEPVHVT